MADWQAFYSEKSVWLIFRYFYFSLVLLLFTSHLTSADPRQQFSAPFHAGHSRQAQTFNIPQAETQSKCNMRTGSH